MINFLKNWAEEIIVAVVISVIFESILPEGSNKKYVKVVIGIYIVFTILNPLLGNISKNIDFDSSIKMNTIETSSIDTDNIRNLYVDGINQNLKEDIKNEFGYTIKDINIVFNDNYENIEKIILSLENEGIKNVKKVEIGEENEEENIDNNYSDIKEYLFENYQVTQDKIFIR